MTFLWGLRSRMGLCCVRTMNSYNSLAHPANRPLSWPPNWWVCVLFKFCNKQGSRRNCHTWQFRNCCSRRVLATRTKMSWQALPSNVFWFTSTYMHVCTQVPSSVHISGLDFIMSCQLSLEIYRMLTYLFFLTNLQTPVWDAFEKHSSLG